jgi:gluconate 2-dehydrogenase alpha chain
VGAKSSTLVTKLPDADATGNFKLVTGAMCHRVNTDNSGRATGVSYYGPDGSDNTIEAELVILTTFIYDNTRLLLLSKTDKFPDGLANSSGHLGKHIMTHIRARVLVAFDDRHINIYMGPSARSTASTISTPTTSIIPAWVSSAARKSRSDRSRSKAARSAPSP